MALKKTPPNLTVDLLVSHASALKAAARALGEEKRGASRRCRLLTRETIAMLDMIKATNRVESTADFAKQHSMPKVLVDLASMGAERDAIANDTIEAFRLLTEKMIWLAWRRDPILSAGWNGGKSPDLSPWEYAPTEFPLNTEDGQLLLFPETIFKKERMTSNLASVRRDQVTRLTNGEVYSLLQMDSAWEGMTPSRIGVVSRLAHRFPPDKKERIMARLLTVGNPKKAN